MSILVMYQRIFPVSRLMLNVRRMGSYSVAWWLSLFYVTGRIIAFTFATVFQCAPVYYFWDRRNEGECLPIGSLYTATFTNIVADLVILVLPLPMVWQLQLRLGQKIALTGIFTLGFFVCMTSIVRVVLIFRYLRFNELDFSYYAVPTITWSTLEANVGIICACLPVLRPLFLSCMGVLRNRTAQKSGSSSGLGSLRKSPGWSFGLSPPTTAPRAAGYSHRFEGSQNRSHSQSVVSSSYNERKVRNGPVHSDSQYALTDLRHARPDKYGETASLDLSKVEKGTWLSDSRGRM
ncbi:MAG: hypothetical protein M1833_004023 [Piccolia ochrophora]|nr:MAG: hypothetical protein M1833_004023 [Piccolia ochrophora]